MGKTTAAAVTGPAKHPLPASSVPASVFDVICLISKTPIFVWFSQPKLSTIILTSHQIYFNETTPPCFYAYAHIRDQCARKSGY